MKSVVKFVLIVLCVISSAGPALAQSGSSGIAGVVSDASGARLPGVAVEVASPVLIEKTRVVVTDGEGAYKVLELRPGSYSITFSLSDFSTVRREGIELTASFTATVNAELKVGAVTETITVTGESPLVDVQNVASQRVMTLDTLEALPVPRSPQGYTALIPSVIGQGIANLPGGRDEMSTSSHGSPAGDSLQTLEGVNVASTHGAGGGSNVFRISQSYVQEISVVVGGGTAEQASSGTVINVIPKDGGNTLSGSAYGSYSSDGLANTNLTPALAAQGFTKNSLSRLLKLWDGSGALGGRLVRDRLWFFTSFRDAGTIQTRAGLYDNLTPRGWAYTPDLNRPAVIKLVDISRNARLTWQATPKNKISVFVDGAPHVIYSRGYQFQIAPEATAYAPFTPDAIVVGKWTAPLTSRLLFDATVLHNSIDYNQRGQTPKTCSCSAPVVTPDMISTVEQSTGIMWRAQSNLVGSGNEPLGHLNNHSFRYAASMSYVTGSHAFKGGMQFFGGREWITQEINGALAYTLRNAKPLMITEYANPIKFQNNIDGDLGLFVQDQWAFRRLTLTAGTRWDRYTGGAAAIHLDAGPFVPARDFPKVKNFPLWKDWDPRLAASYNLFGSGKAALKVSLGRYLAAVGSSSAIGGNPVVNSVLQVNRTWHDDDGDFVPDCNLANPLKNGECEQISNLNFGQNNPNATTYDPRVVNGVRRSNWESTIVVQHQLAKGVSITGGYYRKTFANFTVNDNVLVSPSDYSQYCITAPRDPRLPQAGGYRICGLYDVSPTLASLSAIVVKPETDFGKRQNVYNGFDLTENARLPQGINISGGMNIGRTITNTCFVVKSPGALRFCDLRPPFQPNFTFAGIVPLPWYGISTSLAYRDYAGYQVTATYAATNDEVRPSLGRDLANGSTVNVELIQPGTMYGPRQRQVDLRLSKRLRFGHTRLLTNLDIANLFNASTTTGINTTYGLPNGANWLKPTLIQGPRYARIGAQFDF
jgi:hypothetical protein